MKNINELGIHPDGVMSVSSSGRILRTLMDASTSALHRSSSVNPCQNHCWYRPFQCVLHDSRKVCIRTINTSFASPAFLMACTTAPPVGFHGRPSGSVGNSAKISNQTFLLCDCKFDGTLYQCAIVKKWHCLVKNQTQNGEECMWYSNTR
jgi:hypothetical protein